MTCLPSVLHLVMLRLCLQICSLLVTRKSVVGVCVPHSFVSFSLTAQEELGQCRVCLQGFAEHFDSIVSKSVVCGCWKVMIKCLQEVLNRANL